MNLFKRLLIHDWRQFGRVEVDFHPRLTVFTGANGAGKTTILHLLNRHWGWNIPYVSSPRFTKKGVRKYWAGFWDDESVESPALSARPDDIGEIEYSAHPQARLTVPRDVKETFAVAISPQPSVPGVYIPSHRPLYIHQKVEEIPTNVDARQQLFDVYLTEIRNRWAVNQRVRSPSHTLKRSLMSLAMFGYGSEAVVPNEEARKTFEEFQNVLSIILPQSLGFQRLRVRVPDVILETETGEFAFDAVSGGLSALIDVAWQVYLYSTLSDEFVVAIDEPEAHLHPKLQRSVLPNLLQAFPKAQFIVATHNPFVVGSTKDSAVYVLRYGDDRRVYSQLLDQVNKAGTANELLRDVLGLESTSALWVEGAMQEVLDRFKHRPLSPEMLKDLRRELDRIGLARYLPETLEGLEP